MNNAPRDRNVPYIAVVKGAREVTLVCAADYEYWKGRLAPENLVPANVNGRAEVFLSAVQLKWMGVSFRELSVSIRVRDRIESSRDEIYLASAFSTSRLFAFIERHHFRTPYRHAQVEVNAQAPCGFKLFDGPNAVIRAEGSAKSEVEIIDDLWELCIYLPHENRKGKYRGNLFFASLSGKTQVSTYSSSSDAIVLTPTDDHAIIQSLVESDLTGVEWRVRNDATHARSKTYNRERS